VVQAFQTKAKEETGGQWTIPPDSPKKVIVRENMIFQPITGGEAG